MTRASVTTLVSIVGALVLGSGSFLFAQSDQHSGHQEKPKPKPTSPAKPSAEGAHEHPRTSEEERELPPFIPRVTDEDRKVAFQDVQGHAVHDEAVNYFVLFDQLEWQRGQGASVFSVDGRGWVGRDRDRLWYRAEGDSEGGRAGEAQTHVMYGRQISRWWDLVAGIRQDFRPGAAQTWAAIGVQGLAPYWFDVEATAYVGGSGRTHARLEVEYEILLTNRLILQPLMEAEIVGKSDPDRGVGVGLSTTDAGFRLRFELRREVAPYFGVTWSNKWGKTADLAEATDEDKSGPRFVTGLRLWF